MDELDQFCGSDPQAGFDHLIKKYGGFLIAFLSSKFSQKANYQWLADCSQETWQKVWTSRESFCVSNPRNFRAWLFRIGQNEVLQAIRKKRPDEFPENFDQSDKVADSPDQEASKTEQLLKLSERWGLQVENHHLYRCMQQLKKTHEHWYDALISKVLGEAAEEEVLTKYKINRSTLYRWRYDAGQKLLPCMSGATS